MWLSFSLDGGHSWTKPQALIEGAFADPMKHTCGYTSMVAVADDAFWLAYGDFLRPNAQGQPAKAILLRKISVQPSGLSARAPNASSSAAAPPQQS